MDIEGGKKKPEEKKKRQRERDREAGRRYRKERGKRGGCVSPYRWGEKKKERERERKRKKGGV